MRKEEKDRIGEQSIGQYVTVLTWNTECICASYHPPILAEYTCKYGISEQREVLRENKKKEKQDN